MNVFMMDGIAYNVHVTKLSREFSVLDSDNSGRTLDGQLYREPIGTYYNYTMTVAPKDGDLAAMDAFWDAISQPVQSHVCTFPYNQQTLTQKMYVTGGGQDMLLLQGQAAHWGEITVSFTATGPGVTP